MILFNRNKARAGKVKHHFKVLLNLSFYNIINNVGKFMRCLTTNDGLYISLKIATPSRPSKIPGSMNMQEFAG